MSDADCSTHIDRPLLSVVIVTWNGLGWLERCLDAVFAQTYAPLEVIVVDNGSTDGTVAYLQEAYPQVIVVVSAENRGFAAGNNLGIAAAHGELIALLNSDTWLKPFALAQLADERERRGLDVIGPYEGDYWSEVPREPYSTHIDPWGHPVYRADPAAARESFYLTGVCLLFTKALYAITGGLDDNYFMYCEEVDWFWRLHLTGKRIGYSSAVVVYHAGMGSGESGLSAQRFLWRNHNTLQMLVTNYSLLNLLWVLPTYAAGCLLETIVFFMTGRPEIARTYPQGWRLAIHDRRAIWRKRRQVQASRTRPDRELVSLMYLGLGKLHHLATWSRERRSIR